MLIPQSTKRLCTTAMGFTMLINCVVARAQCIESLGLFDGSQSALGDGFGDYISVDGDWMAIGAPFANGRQYRSGLVYMFHRNGPQWSEQSVVFDPTGHEQDRLGTSVSVSGTKMLTAISGADLGAEEAGAAVVFRLTGSRWELEGLLPNPDPHYGDGGLMSVLLDGDYAFVGYPDAEGVQANEGRVHVYHFDGNQWGYDRSIAAPVPHGGDLFGGALARAGDLLLIGAAGYDANDINTGAAFVYHLINGEWIHEATLSGSDAAFNDLVGRAIDISPDWAILGSPQHADDLGAAYIFKRDGNTWSEYARLDSPNPDPRGNFGEAVGIDGDLIVVGQPDQPYFGSGRAFRFRLNNGDWTYEDRMRDIDTWFGNTYANALALNDGVLVIKASHSEIQRIDAVCIYDLDGRCGAVLSADTGCSAETFPLTIRWEGATPNGRIALVHSTARGFFYIPNNFPCAGTWLGINPSNARIVYQGTSGPNGGRVLDSTGTRALCGTYLQLIDLQPCTPSNVIRLDRDTSW